MGRFKKKPVIVEAEQYIEHGKGVRGMCQSISCFTSGKLDCNEPHVHTIHNSQVVVLEVGDWIIPEPDGKHFYPCKSDIFMETYEEEYLPLS